MAHGGKRSGAGRPKGSLGSNTIQAQALKDFLIQEVIKQKKQLVTALINEALNGEIPALKEILDRTLGKAKESIEIDSPQLNPIQQIYEYILSTAPKNFIEARDSKLTQV